MSRKIESFLIVAILLVAGSAVAIPGAMEGLDEVNWPSFTFTDVSGETTYTESTTEKSMQTVSGTVTSAGEGVKVVLVTKIETLDSEGNVTAVTNGGEYSGTTDANSGFSISVPANSTYYLVLENDYGYRVVMGQVEVGDSDVSGIATKIVTGFSLATGEFYYNNMKFLDNGNGTATLVSLGGITKDVDVEIPVEVTDSSGNKYTVTKIGRDVTTSTCNTLLTKNGNWILANYVNRGTSTTDPGVVPTSTAPASAAEMYNFTVTVTVLGDVSVSFGAFVAPFQATANVGFNGTNACIPIKINAIFKGEVSSVGAFAFKSVDGYATFEKGIGSAGDYAFADSAITEFPSGLAEGGMTSIGKSAFMNTGFSTIVLDESLATVGGNAFYGISALEAVYVNSKIALLDESDLTNSSIFSGSDSKIVFYCATSEIKSHLETEWATILENCDKGYSIELAETSEHTISGTVKDSDGNAIAGAKVILYSGDTQVASVDSTENGFSFSGLDDGTYTVVVEATESYSRFSSTIELSADATVDIILSATGGNISIYDVEFDFTGIDGTTIDGITYRLASISLDGSTYYGAQVISVGVVSNGSVVSIPSTVGSDETTYTVVSIGSGQRAYGSSLVSNNSDAPSFSLVVEGPVHISDYAFVSISNVNGAYGYTALQLSSVSFNAGIVSIGSYAFYGTSLKSIDLAGCTSIGISAFENSKLTRVTIPDTVVEVGANSFRWCNDLTEVILECDITSIPSSFLYGDAAVTSIVLPASVTSIGSNAFNGTGLTSINLSGVSELGEYAFRDCTNLSSVTFSNNISEIPKEAFNGCISLTSIELPDSCVTLGSGAFGYTGLTTVNLSKVVDIGSGALRETKLTSVDLSSVKTVGQSAFYNVPASITVGRTVEQIGSSAFSNSGIVSVDLTNVASLGTNAFYGCTSLTTVTGLKGDVPDYCFYGCSSLKVSVSDVTSVGVSAFYGTAIEYADLSKATTISRSAFGSCSSLTGAVLPSGLTSISAGIFYKCTKLSSVTWPTGKVSIGSSAFADTAVDLTEYSLQYTVDDILSLWDYRAFENTPSYVKDTSNSMTYSYLNLKLNENGQDRNVILILYMSVDSTQSSEYYLNLSSEVEGMYESRIISTPRFTVDSDNPVYSAHDGVLYSKDGSTLLRAPTYQEYAEIRDGTVTIGSRAFYESLIAEITVPSSVTTIESYAFTSSSLQRLNLQEGLKTIGNYAFYDTDVIEIDIPDSVEEIGTHAFSYTPGKVILGENSSLKVLGDYAFCYAEGTEWIFIPPSVTSIGTAALYIPTLKSVYLGEGTWNILGSSLWMNSTTSLTGIEFYLPAGTDSGGISFRTLGGATDGQLAGYYVFYDGTPSELDTLVDVGDFVIYVVSGIDGTTVSQVVSNSLQSGQYAIQITTTEEHTYHDIVVSLDGSTVDAEQIASSDGQSVWAYVIEATADVFVTVEERQPETTYTVSFDSDGGSNVASLKVGSGMTILKSDRPVPTKNNSSFLGWYTGDGTEYDWTQAVESDLTLYAKWETADPMLTFGSGVGTITATMGDVTITSGTRVTSSDSVSFTYTSSGSAEFISWSVESNGDVTSYESEELVLTGIQNDTYVTVNIRYVSISSHPAGQIETDAPTADDDLVLYWTFGGPVDTSMSNWTGHSSVPLIVDDYVYVRVGTAIYKVDIDTGMAVKSVDSVDQTAYYHYIGYGHGYIFDYSNGNVYDTDLNLKATFGDRTIVTVFADESSIYMMYRDSDGASYIAKYDQNLTQLWTTPNGCGLYGSWGTVTAPVLVDGYFYWLYLITDDQDEQGISIASVSVNGGDVVGSEVSSDLRGHMIDDGWLNSYEGDLYFTTYTRGLFATTEPDETGYIIRISVQNGTFSDSDVTLTHTEAMGLTSNFEIYNDRGYVLVGNTFYVYDVTDMTVIYSVAASMSHGGIVVNTHNATEANGYEVTIYLIPYSPGQGLYVFTDRTGQETGDCTILEVTTGNYNSQAVRSGPDGQLIWYTDTGQIFCFGLAEDNVYYFYVDDGEESVWLTATGATAAEALKQALEDAGIDSTISSSEIVSIDGKTGWNMYAYGNESLTDKRYMTYDWQSVQLSASYTDQLHYFYVTNQTTTVDDGTDLYYRSGSAIGTYEFDSTVGDDSIIGVTLHRTADFQTSAIDTVTAEVVGNRVSVSVTLNSEAPENAVVAIYIGFSDGTFQRAYVSAAGIQLLQMNGSAAPSTILVYVYDGMPDLTTTQANYGFVTGTLATGTNTITG